MEIILDLVLVAIIVLMVLLGIKRGLVKTCVVLISTILVVVVAVVAVGPVTDMIIVGTDLDADLTEALESPLAEKLPNAYAKVFYFDLNDDGEKELVYEIDGVKAPFEDIFKENALLDFVKVAGLLTEGADELLQTGAELNLEIDDYKDQTNTIDFIDCVTAPIVSIIFTVAIFVLLLIVTRILLAILAKLLKKLISSPPGGGQWTLNLKVVHSRVAGDSGTITLRCKDLRVLQLDIEGVEATLDIARSIEVCQGCNGGT